MAYRPLEDSLGFIVGLTNRKVTHLVNSAFRSHDITAEQWIMLMCLTERSGITQTELGQMSGKDKTTITRLVDILERKELVVKQSHPTDRRASILILTDKGERVAHALVDVEQTVMERVVSGLSDAEVDTLKTALRAVQKNAEGFLEGMREE